MINRIAKRFSDIAAGRNNDNSNEYYTMFPAFSEMLLEILARASAGKKYKVIICPCDSKTSIFRELENYKDLIGNPRTIYSFYPEKSWEDYFDMDYEKEFGVSSKEVLICTNPPFKNLTRNLMRIKCHYLLFGSNAVGIQGSVHAKPVKVSLYIKNNTTFNGSADEPAQNQYGRVCTVFYSDTEFLTCGEQYINKHKQYESLLFGKDRLERIR